MDDDYTEEQRWEIRQRALAALADADQDRAAWEERAAANKNARLLAEAQSMASQQPKPIVPPVAASAQRDDGWTGWRNWGNAVNARLGQTITTATLNQIIEGVGAAIGEVTREERAATKKQLDALEARMTANEGATVQLITEQESRIAQLEARMAAAETRAAPTALRRVT